MRDSGAYLENTTPGRPHAAGVNQRVQVKLNKCSVRFSPEDGALSRFSHCVIVLILWQHFGQAKIADFHPHLGLHQDVPGGQVSVDVPLGSQVIHSLERGQTDGYMSASTCLGRISDASIKTT